MKGPLAMLTGKGGREYKNSHDEFKNAIPDRFPFRMGDVVKFGPGDYDVRDLRPGDKHLPSHPAYEGPLSRTREAELYRRANSVRGGKTKIQHQQFSEYQRTHNHRGEEIEERSAVSKVFGWLLGKE